MKMCAQLHKMLKSSNNLVWFLLLRRNMTAESAEGRRRRRDEAKGYGSVSETRFLRGQGRNRGFL